MGPDQPCEVLRLDEPSLGLASTTVQSIFEILVTPAEQGIGLLLVEQRANVALLCQTWLRPRKGACGHERYLGGAAVENSNVKAFFLGIKQVKSTKGFARYERCRPG